MYVLLKKEILHLLGSPIAYLIMGIFLLLNGFFLFFFQQHLLQQNTADLDLFFQINPYLLLFLIPSLTMMSFAQERKQGTLEIIYTLPLSLLKWIMAKFLSIFLLLILCLLPAFLYYGTISYFAYPQGNIDTGAFLASFIGILLLSLSLISISLFFGSFVSQPINAFLLGFLGNLCGWFFFDACMDGLPQWAGIFVYLSLQQNYQALSLGLLPLREMGIFLLITTFFLYLTYQMIHFKRQ